MLAQFSTLLRLSDGLAIDLSNELLRKAKVVGIVRQLWALVIRTRNAMPIDRFQRDTVAHVQSPQLRVTMHVGSSAVCIACRMLVASSTLHDSVAIDVAVRSR
jgi:hypothetical protein